MHFQTSALIRRSVAVVTQDYGLIAHHIFCVPQAARALHPIRSQTQHTSMRTQHDHV